jgi:hypothetical protein
MVLVDRLREKNADISQCWNIRCICVSIFCKLFYFVLIYESLTQRKLLKFQVFYHEIERNMCVVMYLYLYLGDSMFCNFTIKLRKEWMKKCIEWRRYKYSRLGLKCDGIRTETRVCLSAKRMNQFKLAGVSVQSTTGSRGVRISGSNAGCTMFWGSVKRTGYPFHSPVSPSLPLPCVTMCHRISTGLYL